MQDPKIYSPDKVNIHGEGPNPTTLKTCGKQVFKIVNEEGKLVSRSPPWFSTHAERKTKLNVAVYNVFHPDHLQLMIEHSRQIPRNSHIQRGGQFDFFSEGEMVGIGSRAPAGGAPGDCYRPYNTISANSLNDIDLLFNYTEVDMYLLPVILPNNFGMFRILQSS